MNQSLPVSAGVGPLLNSASGTGRPVGAAGQQSDTTGFGAMMGHAATQTEAEAQSEKVISKIEDGEGLPTGGDSLPVSDEEGAVSSVVVAPERSASGASQSMAENVATTVAQISGFREADLSVSGRMLKSASETPAAMSVQERIAALASSGVVVKSGGPTESDSPMKVAETLAAGSVFNDTDFKGAVVPGAVLPGSALPASELNDTQDKQVVQSPALLVDRGLGKGLSNSASVGVPELAAERAVEALKAAENSVVFKANAFSQASVAEQSAVGPEVLPVAAPAEALLAAVQRGNEQLVGETQLASTGSYSTAGNTAGATVVDTVSETGAVGLQQGARDIVVPVDSVKAQVAIVDENGVAVARQEATQEQSRAMSSGGTSATDVAQPLSPDVVTGAAPVAVEGLRDIGERPAVRAAVEADPLQRSSLNSQALDGRQPVVSTVVADNKPLGDDVQSQQPLSASQKLMPGSESEQLLKQVGEKLSESPAADANAKNLTKTQAFAESFAASLASSAERSGKVTAESQIATLPNGVKPGMPAWNQAINERIVMLSSQNGRFVEIQLDPPELGSLQVKLQIKNDQVSVVFNTPHGSVREALEQGLPRLREMFEEQGLNLADSSVEDQGAGQQEAKDEADQQFASSSYRGFDDGAEADSVEAVQQASLSLVDYYA